MSGEKRSAGRGFARFLGVVYVLALVVLALALRYVGERFWLTTLVMYLPRVGYLLPMPFVCGLLFVVGERRYALGTFLVSTLLVVFALMGVKVSGRHETASPSIRLMTWNTFFGRIENESIRQAVADEKPDIFLSQATAHRTKELFERDPGDYHLENDEEFFLATRFRIVEKFVAPPLVEDPDHRGSFARYTLETPLGLIDVYNVHPRSPREGVQRARGKGFRSKITDPTQVDEAAGSIAENTLLRRRQVAALVAAVRASKNPVLIAGDTNLPTLSWLFHSSFDGLGLEDGFDAAGAGLGYTFPAKRPWLRIDRVLASERFRFLAFKKSELVASDHLYVVADLAAK